MEQSSSGRLKKMGFDPNKTKSLNPKASEETELEPREISNASEELTETAKLRLARTPTQVEIDFPDGMECPSCKEKLGLGEIICMTCELNVQTGKRLKSKIKKSRNAYAAPKASTNDLPDDIDWGGIGRGKYWLYLIIFTIVTQGISHALIGDTTIDSSDPLAQLSGAKGASIFALTFTSFIVSIVLQVGRLRNLGMSGWRYLQQSVVFVPILAIFAHWSLVIITGIIAIFIYVRYFYWIHICPSGYEDHRKLDKNGKIILGILIALFTLTLAGVAFFILYALNEVQSSAY